MANLSVDGDVDKVVLGADTIWQNSDGWVPLVLPDSALDGTVFFKDLGDGTALLAGVARYAIAAEHATPTAIINPPKGYEFVSVPWSAGIYDDGIMTLSGMTGTSMGTGKTFSAVVSDGKVLLKGNGAIAGSQTILFTQNASEAKAVSSMPARAVIKRV